ncbi:MAG: hypothetical protein DRP45_07430 [Candidatus Zixiibacteriota bacterium]|nr:MAG: hypothetical protein DRP45_07430 [candidate division Zixibacteria bacterium]
MNTRAQTISILVAILTVSSVSAANKVVDAVEKGNEAFVEQRYKDALEQYQIAETEIPESAELDYNMGGVLHQQGKYEGAVEKYTRALNTTDINLEAIAQYNLGNTYYRMDDYQNAIKSFENALNINPEDMEAKFNLELARRMLKEQMKPESEEQQEQEQQQQQQEQQQEQQKEEDEKQEGQEEQQQQQENQEDQQDQQQEQQAEAQQEKQMSKEDAERILNALRDDEQDVQKKIRRANAGGNYVGKDW